MVMILLMLFLAINGGYRILVGLEQKNKNRTLSGFILLALLAPSIPLAVLANDAEERRIAAMDANILKKYEFLEDRPGSRVHYLQDVEYEGTRRHERGTYFDLLYADGSISSASFTFDKETGEPEPVCVCNLKPLEEFLSRD